MTTDLSSKLKQVIEQIPKEVLYDFVCSYAHSLDIILPQEIRIGMSNYDSDI